MPISTGREFTQVSPPDTLTGISFRRRRIARWIIKLGAAVSIGVMLIVYDRVTVPAIATLLVLVASDVTYQRFVQTRIFSVLKALLTVGAVAIDPVFAPAAAVVALDIAAHGNPSVLWIFISAIPPILASFLVPTEILPVFFVAACASASVGYVSAGLRRVERSHLAAFTRERSTRYRLENAQVRLDETSRELVRTVERAERSRIAHAIHDHVGHSLTGILIQLQASEKLAKSSPERSGRMLSTAIDALTEAIVTVRETVHDLRPRTSSDSTVFRRLFTEFRYCGISLSADDDAFDALPERVRETIVSNTRELLTNAVHHSRATHVDYVLCEDNERVQVMYHDDGIGAETIREGIGFSGIRRRTHALGGRVEVSSVDGFSVRMILPTASTREEENGLDSRCDR